MNYNSLFDLIYSTEISEATKDSIIDRIDFPINESAEVQPIVETYIDLLDTLVLSTASEALIYNIIDEVFSSVDEAIINEVSDEWIKRKTEAGLQSRKETLDKANKSVKSGVIGLSQLRNQEKAQQRYNKGVQLKLPRRQVS